MVRPHLQSVYDHSMLAKHLSRDLQKKVPLKLGIMSTISPDEIVDLIANIRVRHPEVELKLCDANAKDLRARLLAGDLEVVIYALPGEEPDDRIHSIPLFREQMVLAIHRGHRLAKARVFPVREMNDECYIHRVNCEFAGYADEIFSNNKELLVRRPIGVSAMIGPWQWSQPGWDLHSCPPIRSNTRAC